MPFSKKKLYTRTTSTMKKNILFLLHLIGVTFIFPSLSAQEKSLQPTFSTDRHYQPVLVNSFDSKQEISTQF